ncbi:MAG: hypothetical protein K5898_12620 [Ruminococcus sp.]|uniref:hypothetical protein n=1 Tax=Ruminococcus sp. TaxID=41978 RepID=UPI0025CD8DA9|nr:hypothetical protein [Ruminococcus sp.]MCR4795985.1 hypothetical protein [Ruminococcus sp.]
MKFKIHHRTKALYLGVVIPWIVSICAFLLFIFLGFNIHDTLPTKILIGILALCAAVEIFFLILYTAERISGATIIIENDHIDIRTIMRFRRFYFDMIADTKYTHYDEGTDSSSRRSHRKYRYSQQWYNNNHSHTTVRAKLIFYLTTDKVFIINDDATGYVKKQKKWITDPHLDPDEDVKLYQAYKCLCSAFRHYYNSQQQL